MINSEHTEVVNEICKVVQSRRLECVRWWEHFDRCRIFAHRPKEDELEIRVTVDFVGTDREFDVEVFTKGSSQRLGTFSLDTPDLLTKVRAQVHKVIALLDWSE